MGPRGERVALQRSRRREEAGWKSQDVASADLYLLAKRQSPKVAAEVKLPTMAKGRQRADHAFCLADSLGFVHNQVGPG